MLTVNIQFYAITNTIIKITAYIYYNFYLHWYTMPHLINHLNILNRVTHVKLPNNNLSIDSELFMKLLFTRIILSFDEWRQRKTSIINSFGPCAKFDLPNYETYPNNIRDEISLITPTYHDCRFTIDDRNICIRILSQKKPNMQNICQNIFVWLNTLHFYAPHSCSQTLTIYLTLLDKNKIVPDDLKDTIGREHANSAFTFPCREQSEIHIFREEEWFKVFIHETFHAFGMDFSGKDNTHIEELATKSFNISPAISELRIYEAYCETFAELIQLMFISYHSIDICENLDKWISNLLKKTMYLLHYEQMFSMFQIGKILFRYRMPYTLLITPSGTNSGYRENTHVISYYAIKSSILFNIDQFLLWVATNNRFSICFANQNHNIENLMLDFYQKTRKLTSNVEYIKNMKIVEQWIDENHSNPTYQALFKTMRMSIFEFA